MGSFKNYLIEGEVKKRNKASKNKFFSRLGKIYNAYGRSNRPYPPRHTSGPQRNRDTAEDKATARHLIKHGDRPDITAPDKVKADWEDKLSKRRAAATAGADRSSTEIVGDAILEGFKLFTEAKGKYAAKAERAQRRREGKPLDGEKTVKHGQRIIKLAQKKANRTDQNVNIEKVPGHTSQVSVTPGPRRPFKQPRRGDSQISPYYGRGARPDSEK